MTLKTFIFSSPYASRKSVKRFKALTYKKHQILSHYTRLISRSQQKSMEADSFSGARSWQLNASWCIFGLVWSKLVYMIGLIALITMQWLFFQKVKIIQKKFPTHLVTGMNVQNVHAFVWLEFVQRILLVNFHFLYFFLQVDNIRWIQVNALKILYYS